MGALRVFVWFTAFVTALETWNQIHLFRNGLEELITLRHTILSKDEKLSQKFCRDSPGPIQLDWREENLWTDVCSSFTGFSELPRYWKLTFPFKYKLLFIQELPITVSIVISA